MTKSPAHSEQPASDKASAAAEENQLRPGKSDLKAPRDSDWLFAAKQQRRGFDGQCHSGESLRGQSTAQPTRQVSEHRYKVTPYGSCSGQGRVATQNMLAGKRGK